MSTRAAYDHGTPCWIDLISPDVDASTAFYTGLFGWTAEDSHDPGSGQRVYTNFHRDGQLVAGMAAQQEGMAGMPAVWASYVAVDDVDAVADRVADAGGQVMMPPMQVMTQGRMALIGDPAGAMLGLWQAQDHIGAQVVNEPRTWSWNELLSRDVDAAMAFYSAVLGWTYEGQDMGGFTYHVIVGGEEGGLGGLMQMPEGIPDSVPSYWGVYFTVDDLDATVARATDLGATIANGPDDSPVGRMATLMDPQGGSFTLIQPPTA